MIGIIGYGVVGRITREIFFPEEKVVIHDISMGTDIESVYGCEVIFICISAENSESISELKSMCLDISKNNQGSEIIIRTTVTPGFFEDIKTKIKNPLTYFPEFLRDRYAVKDAVNCKRMFYATTSDESVLKQFNRINSKLRRINFSELELLKMMRNNYHAMKIVFANHYYDLCKKYGADYEKLLEYFNKSKNGQSYLDVNESLRGYGGKCLPKDIDFMIDIFGENVELFKSIKNDNSKIPITVRDDI